MRGYRRSCRQNARCERLDRAERRRTGPARRPRTPSAVGGAGRPTSSRGASSRCPRTRSACCPTSPAPGVVEIGCGTAYISAWLARRGASAVVGLDPTPAQLATARRSGAEIGPRFPLVRGGRRGGAAPRAAPSTSPSPSTAPPSGPTRSSGSPRPTACCAPAASWCSWRNAVLFTLCAPDAEAPAGSTLVRDQARPAPRRVHRRPRRGVPPPPRRDGPAAAPHRLRGARPRRAPRARGARPKGYIDADWGRRWPMEEIWRARKR